MIRHLTLVLFCAVLALAMLLPATASYAQSSRADRVYEKYRGNDGKGKETRARISLDQAVNMVRRRAKGKVIGSSTSRSGSRIVHRIKVLNNGNVRTYSVDAVSGKIR
ncbi:MAG: PepSY domain-containing protein [Gammaproteobacteria bacterium]